MWGHRLQARVEHARVNAIITSKVIPCHVKKEIAIYVL